MPSDIRQSQTYIWSTNDVLGKGATSVVYRGINRITGSFVAVKTFNNFFMAREFEVLRKINHENIVKLLAIETEEDRIKDKPKRHILVTELCTGGCLNDILEEPENIYGLEDAEFLKVLAHLHEGMKYLRENDIVHRDLKPGNIMKFMKDDGTSVYKLIDFGAARELSDDKGFQSLYGTEEYLYPDMYERALLGVHAGKTFRATVDLWSIGVTLYHVAAGELPFRPFGGRKNRDTMHYITSQKKSGVISGVQDTPNGQIRWGTELPSNCLLSVGLKKLITPLIAGLLESDSNKSWKFERFFSEVDSILSAKVVHVFHANQTDLIKVYLKLDEENIHRQFREEICAQTRVAPDEQLFIYNNNPIKTINDISPTSENCPIFLFSAKVTTMPPLVLFPQTVTFGKQKVLIDDVRRAMLACVNGYRAKRLIEKCALNSKLICQTVGNMSDCLNAAYDKMNQNMQHLLDKIQTLKRTAEIFEVSQRVSSYPQKTGSSQELKQISDKFSEEAVNTILNLHKKHCQEDCLKSNWDLATKDLTKPFNTRCIERASILVNELDDSRLHLRRGRDYPVSQNDQYMIERRKIENALNSLIILLENEVHPQHTALIKIFEDWCEIALNDFLKLEKLSVSIKKCQMNLEEFEEKLVLDNNRYNEYLETRPNPIQVNRKIKTQLSIYKRDTKGFTDVIEENMVLMNNLDDCMLNFNKNNYSFDLDE